MVDLNEKCLICFTNSSNKLRKCQGCSKLFCTTCILTWKFLKNQCPNRCGEKWNIDLDDIDEYNSNGFIICPLDKSIGSYICSNCKNPNEFILFKKVRLTKYKCPFCKEFVDYYNSIESNEHIGCGDQRKMYYYCNSCKRKYCPCLSQSI